MDYSPFQCPTCGRTRWTHAEKTYCQGGTNEPHPYAEMELIRIEDAPAETSPDIVTT